MPKVKTITMNAGNWNQETKMRLNEKVLGSMNDMGSLVRQIVKGSKSNELLAQAAKNFSSQETAIQNSMETLKKMDLIKTQLEYHLSLCFFSMSAIDDIHDQLHTIQR
ncbi:hypothetical protein ACJMK2_006312 [Sinanodonta woodiana]|uniref:BLOC-1-related complex subunit 7 n=1 Tax=Sinanodonta woodiana TaxID=1069815 RepID=A0ABD3VUE5_SINWO